MHSIYILEAFSKTRNSETTEHQFAIFGAVYMGGVYIYCKTL